jgi:hypothetical protein
MNEETWRPIARHAGYEVSDLGRVRSLDRIITKIQCGRTVYARQRGCVLRPGRTRVGYLLVVLGRGAPAYVHHLVLEAFVGPRPAGCQAAHGDGNKLNNTLENLRWASPKENNADKVRHGTYLFGARTPNGRKTHCLRGHPFDSRNTKWNKGRRNCRTCRREHDHRRRAGVNYTRAAAASPINNYSSSADCHEGSARGLVAYAH